MRSLLETSRPVRGWSTCISDQAADDWRRHRAMLAQIESLDTPMDSNIFLGWIYDMAVRDVLERSPILPREAFGLNRIVGFAKNS